MEKTSEKQENQEDGTVEQNYPAQIDALITQVAAGDSEAFNKLVRLAEKQMRNVASQKLKKCGANANRPTTLVSDFWVHVFGEGAFRDLKNYRYFISAAGSAMENVLVNRARERAAKKRGGDFVRQPFEVALDQYLDDFYSENQVDVIWLSEGILRLREEEAELLRMHFFRGRNYAEIAKEIGISPATAKARISRILVQLRELMGDEK